MSAAGAARAVGEGSDADAPLVPDGAAWMRHMMAGDWTAAWAVSDAVLRTRAGMPSWHLPRHEQWIWDGTPVDGRRVLVRCYHGLGDTLQFARFLPALGARAAHVTLWAQPALLPLLARTPGVDRFLPLHDGTPDAEWDVDVEVMELAHLFRATPASLPRDVPYLALPDDRGEPTDAPPERDAPLEVGLVWSAGDWNHALRSIPFAALAPLFALDGVRVHVLQRGPALAECPPDVGVHDGSDDVLETARRVRGLDLVIAVDTMMAHLAGALAVPTWTLLAHDADWRWMAAPRDDSPWYPTMRLVRQPRPGDWDAVIARTARALARAAEAKRAGAPRAALVDVVRLA